MGRKSQWTLDTLKEFFERILFEQQKALDAALVAAKAAVTAAFAASDKAITKAEEAQKDYNARSNEFRAALADQSKTFLARQEADARFQQLRDLIDAQKKEIVELQKAESRGEGSSTTSATSKTNSQWMIALLVSVVLVVLGWIGTVVFFLATKKP
jgi:multidrug resistance efflux pump